MKEGFAFSSRQGTSLTQDEVCFLCFRLLSRRCHNISSISKLFPCPSQNRTSGFPIHPAPRLVIQCAPALRPFHLSVSGLFPSFTHSLHSVDVSPSTGFQPWEPSLGGD